MPGEDENRRALESAIENENETPAQRDINRKLLEMVTKTKGTPDELKALTRATFEARIARAAAADDPYAIVRDCVERISEAAREMYAAMHGPRVAITIDTSDGGATIIGYALKEHGDGMGRSMVYGINGVAITLRGDPR